MKSMKMSAILKIKMKIIVIVIPHFVQCFDYFRIDNNNSRVKRITTVMSNSSSCNNNNNSNYFSFLSRITQLKDAHAVRIITQVVCHILYVLLIQAILIFLKSSLNSRQYKIKIHYS